MSLIENQIKLKLGSYHFLIFSMDELKSKIELFKF